MSSLLAELPARARYLPPDERAPLADGLLESLRERASPEVEVVWNAEVLDRIGERERSAVRILVRLIGSELRLSPQM